MTMPDVQDGPAVYFDGASSRKHQVTLHLGSTLDIVKDGAVVAIWPFRRNPPRRRPGGPASPGMQVCGAAGAPRDRRCGDDAGRDRSLPRARRRSRRACADGAHRAAGPPRPSPRYSPSPFTASPYVAERLAPLVPYSVEQRMGEAVDAQVRAIFGAKVCDEPAGRAAFAKLAEKLRTAGGIEHPLEAQVLPSSIPNAIALPGARSTCSTRCCKRRTARTRSPASSRTSSAMCTIATACARSSITAARRF